MLTPIVGMVMAAAAIGVPGWLLGWLGCCDERPDEGVPGAAAAGAVAVAVLVSLGCDAD